MQRIILIAFLLLYGMQVLPAHAQDIEKEVAELRQLVADMKNDYEQRISELESRLSRAERLASSATRDAEEAYEIAEQSAIDQSAGSSSPNAFNPGVGAVLTGMYASASGAWESVPGFVPAGEHGHGGAEKGFHVGETEINLKASVDARFYGNLTFALHEGEAEVEEAWLQTTSLPAGLTLAGGRMFSAAGYLNSFHMHADDFVDRPLPYQAFFGGRYTVDGLRARWVAPTPLLVELGAEASEDAYSLFAKIGGDVGSNHAWQAGIAHISTDSVGGEHEHEGEAEEGEEFIGDSDLTIVDFVWKWAPEGNTTVRNFKIQGEYFSRSESGLFGDIDYDGDQSGWYLQGAWQFAPMWRAGLRYDEADVDNGPLLAGTVLEDPGRTASRVSAMLDFSPSEYSRLRLQYTKDDVLPDSQDQWFLQYIMSLGAHGAHQF